MSDSLFSSYWYRVAKLKPALRDTIIISRHIYREEPWYVLHNSLNGRNHRFNLSAYLLIGQMDGKRTVQEIWDCAGNKTGDGGPSQDEIIYLLGQLYNADLISCDILPATAELFRMSGGTEDSRAGRLQRLSNPFLLRFPLWDPDRFLTKWSSAVAPLFSTTALVLWIIIICAAMVTAVLNWPELYSAANKHLLLSGNLVLMWFIFPVIKFLHEAGHAFAVKRWGGEVHETGIILLAFTPVPYVDATDSTSFPEKKKRILVAAMGIMVELLIASFALFIWLGAETGMVSAIAFNIVFIGGASTIFFNGNPLLRYDGYYILSDLIEIPNLSQRSMRYLNYLAYRYLAGIESVESPAHTRGERFWFILYGPASFCYRFAVAVGLAWFISGYFFFVGMAIAVWGAVTLLIVPAIKNVSSFLSNPEVQKNRMRLTGLTLTFFTAMTLFLLAVPMPLWTTTQGVVWLSEQSAVRAGTDCEIEEVFATDGQHVRQGMPLIRGNDPFLRAEIAVQQASLEELYSAYRSLSMFEQVKRKIMLEKIQVIKDTLARLHENQQKLLVCSPAEGKLVFISTRDLRGSFIKRGTLLGYIVSGQNFLIRAVVSQEYISLVRKGGTKVKVRLADQVSQTFDAHIKRIVPEAMLELPSAAMGTSGGGKIPVNPSDPLGKLAIQSLFQIELVVPAHIQKHMIGERVYVRLDLGRMPLALQAYRSFRQLFLKKFHV